MTELLNKAMFTPHIGSDFAVRLREHADVLTLLEVEDLRFAAPNEQREGFVLSFRGSSTTTLFDQQILPLDHPMLGLTEIMLTPCGRDKDGIFHYEAVFN